MKEKQKFNLKKLLPIATIIVGLFLLGQNLFLLYTGVKTTGIVIKNIQKTAGGKTYYPVAEFTLENGQTLVHEFNDHSSNQQFFSKGETISIIYPHNKPSEAKINSFIWMYCFPGIFILVGGILFFVIDYAYWS